MKSDTTTAEGEGFVLEIKRAERADDLYGLGRLKEIAAGVKYLRQKSDSTAVDAAFLWTPEVFTALDGLRARAPDPCKLPDLGDALRTFLKPLDWGKDAAALADGSTPVHLTLRLGAAELFALPWEAVKVDNSQLLGELPHCVIRYEIPGNTTAKRTPEPPLEHGRILVAWADGNPPVPHEAHLASIRGAWKEGNHPDVSKHVIELEKASLKSIGEALTEASKNNTPVHVLHLLCHGARVDSGKEVYGLYLASENGRETDTVNAKRLRDTLKPHVGTLRLVVLCACHGGDAGQIDNRLGSIAMVLHELGIPAVIASRFPLSIRASNVVTAELYRMLLQEGTSLDDAYKAARTKVLPLATNPNNIDWASLQLYAREADGGDQRPIVVRPYRGLLAFSEEHASYFFGRNDKIAEAVSDLTKLVDGQVPPALLEGQARSRFLVVSGASGTGKSSLVMAGMVPALKKLGWQVAPVLRPTSEWMSQLDKVLASPPRGGSSQLLLVIDQFEEIFTVLSREDRDSFVRRLWALSGDASSGVAVIATLRIDYLSRCNEVHVADGLSLESMVYDEAHRIFVPKMGRSALREIIEQPAKKVGIALAEGLVEWILNDAGDEPGALPLIEYTLDELWKRRKPGKYGRYELTHEDYKDLGGISGALKTRADTILKDFDETQRGAAKRLLVQLVDLRDDASLDTRRRVRSNELRRGPLSEQAVFDRALQELAKERLVVMSRVSDKAAPGQEKAQPFVEIAHEQLVRSWDTLREWLKDLRPRELELRRLGERAKLGGRLEGEQLAAAQRLLEESPDDVNAESRDLVRKSRAEIERLNEQERSFRDTLRVTLAREYLVKDPLVSVALLREVETNDPAQLPSWLECTIEVLRRPAMPMVALEGHDDLVNSAAWSPDGTRIVTASRDKTVRVWNAATGELLWSGDHVGDARTAAWSSDETQIVTASGDEDEVCAGRQEYTVRVWGASTGTALAERPLRMCDPAGGAAFFHDATRIIVRDFNGGPTRVLNVATGEEIATMHHGSFTMNAAWSLDGTRVVTAIKDGTVMVWNAETGAELCTLRGPDPREEVCAAAWSPDGTRIVTGSVNRTAQVWNAATGEELATLVGHEHFVSAVAWSPDGTRIATGSYDATARVWDAETGEELAALRSHASTVTSVAWSPEGARIVTTTYRTARVWNAFPGSALERARVSQSAPGEMLAELIGHAGLVLSATVESDRTGDVRSSSTSDPTRTWVALTGEVLVVLRHESSVASAAWSPDGTRIVTASQDGKAHVWSTATGEEILELTGHARSVRSAAWAPDGTRIVTASWDQTARVWDAATGKELRKLEGPGILRRHPSGCPVFYPWGAVSAAWSCDGTRIVTTSSSWTAEVWDTATYAMLGTLEGHEGQVHSAAWSPDGKRIVTVSEDKSARVWDTATHSILRKLEGHTKSVTSAAWDPDGKRIVTASEDNTARVWDAATYTMIHKLEGHMEKITSVAWSPDGTRIVTASADKSARVWDAATGKVLTRLVGHTWGVNSAAWWTPKKPTKTMKIVTASDDGTTMIWNLEADHLRDRLWQATPLCLPAPLRMKLLGEDEITATKNEKAHREEEARRRAARPILEVKVVIPDVEEQRRRWERRGHAESPQAAVSEQSSESTEHGTEAVPAVAETPPVAGPGTGNLAVTAAGDLPAVTDPSLD